MSEAPSGLAEGFRTEIAQPLRAPRKLPGQGRNVGDVRWTELRGLLSRYSDTLVQQILTAGLGVISGVLAPRLLGPQGRGELAAVTLWPLTIISLSALGIDRATVFFGAKSRRGSSAVASACLAVVGAQSLIVIVAGLLIIPKALQSYGPGIVRLGIVFLLGAPLVQTTSLGSNLLLGRLQTLPYNIARAVVPGCYAVVIATLFVLHIPSVSAIVLAQLIGYGIAAWLVVRFVLRRLRPNWNWNIRTMKDMVKYGARTHLGELTSFMNQRLDQLVISLFLPSTDLGIYVAAVAFSDSLLIIPRGIGAVTLACGSNSDDAGASLWARRSMLLTLFWLAPAAVALWLLCPFLIPHLFGADFALSVRPCRLLILGTVAMGFSTVLYEVARSVNRPEIPAYAEMAGLAATIALLALLLKPYGAVGAAIASSAAYLLTLIFMLGYVLLRRKSIFAIGSR